MDRTAHSKKGGTNYLVKCECEKNLNKKEVKPIEYWITNRDI